MDINNILELHKKWLNDEKSGVRADLHGADLREADMRGADIDFACWPLWCGGLDVHIDDRQAIQLLYHLIRNVNYSKNISNDLKAILLTDDLINLANKFHRCGECGKIENAPDTGASKGKK